MKHYDVIVYIGRFQPPHLAHIELMKMAMKRGTVLITLIGSANQPRTIKNPWTWQERAMMAELSLPDYTEDTVRFAPLRDIMYNDQKWALQVQEQVLRNIPKDMADDNPSIAIIGHSKDETSYYLKMFPQWETIDVPNIEDIHASDIRTAYFTMEPDEFDLKVGRNLPHAIHSYLKAFALRPEYEQLVREYEFIQAYKKQWEKVPYAVQFQTADAVVIQSGHILLVKRRSEPGKGLWALPGGFVNPGERVKDAAIRELREETRLKVPEPVLRGSIKANELYDHPERSLRGRTITNAYLIELAHGDLPPVKGSDDAEKAKWVPLGVFQTMEDQLFEDHFHIVNDLLDQA